MKTWFQTTGGYLRPCPFCGAGTTRIDDQTYWTGQRSIVLSVTLSHWCEEAPDDHSTPPGQTAIVIRAATQEKVVSRWNQGVERE